MVEYSLIVALIVVPSILSIKFVTAQGSRQVVNQADCVATRPPPPACQIPALTTTTTLIPPPPTTAPPPPPPPPPAPTFGSMSTSYTPSPASTTANETVTYNVTITQSGLGVDGALLQVQVREYAPGLASPGYLESLFPCTTNGSGTCTYAYTTTYFDASKVEFMVVSADTNPAPAYSTSAATRTLP